MRVTPRLLECVERRVEGLHRGTDEFPVPGPGDAPGGAQPRRRRNRRCRTGDRVERITQIGRDLLALHHAGAAFRERCFLARFRRKLSELVDRVAQELGFLRCARSTFALMLSDRRLGRASRLPQAADLVCLSLEPSERVEQTPVRGRINKRALIMLTVDLDQHAAKVFQDLHAHWLIVDEGPRRPRQAEPVAGSTRLQAEYRCR